MLNTAPVDTGRNMNASFARQIINAYKALEETQPEAALASASVIDGYVLTVQRGYAIVVGTRDGGADFGFQSSIVIHLDQGAGLVRTLNSWYKLGEKLPDFTNGANATPEQFIAATEAFKNIYLPAAQSFTEADRTGDELSYDGPFVKN